jgi:hypothetical protein
MYSIRSGLTGKFGNQIAKTSICIQGCGMEGIPSGACREWAQWRVGPVEGGPSGVCTQA